MPEITIQGTTYPLEMTVQAFAEISDLCPGRDFKRIDEIRTWPMGDLLRVSAKILAILSNAAEEKRAFEEPGYEKSPLSPVQVLTLHLQDYFHISSGGILKVIQECMGTPQVEVEEEKKTNDPPVSP